MILSFKYNEEMTTCHVIVQPESINLLYWRPKIMTYQYDPSHPEIMNIVQLFEKFRFDCQKRYFIEGFIIRKLVHLNIICIMLVQNWSSNLHRQKHSTN